MRLFEEYFQRHQITQVPVVYHCVSGSLLLRTNDRNIWKNRWVLINLKWQHGDGHPGKYHFDVSLPIHDGFLKGSIFERCPTIQKNWQEYEDFIDSWASSLRGVEPVCGIKEIFLCAWEMFVFMCDSWFMKQTYEIKEFLFQTLNIENSIDVRFEYYENMMNIISIKQPSLIRVWRYEVLSRVQCYANWLAVLVQDKRQP
jgi:hypothetical protein